MRKEVYSINIDYTFNPAHKGANYTFNNGINWVNNGEFSEILCKSVLGFDSKKDANTPYDKGSDIEELNASVKSSRFTLVNMKLANTFEESITKYFQTVHSSIWIYVIVVNDEVNLYYMDKEEFKEFLYEFSGLNERQVIRAKATSGKMIAWFENKLN